MLEFKGTHLPCPSCGETEEFKVNITTGEFTCVGCEAEHSYEFMCELIEKWRAIIDWLNNVPR